MIAFLVKIWLLVTTRGPVGLVRNLYYIAHNYNSDLHMIVNGVDSCREQLGIVESYVKRATKVHLDIPASMEDCTTVIIVGTYRGKDHVRTFSLRPGSIDGLITQLKDMQRYAQIERVDAPGGLDATVKRSLLI